MYVILFEYRYRDLLLDSYNGYLFYDWFFNFLLTERTESISK